MTRRTPGFGTSGAFEAFSAALPDDLWENAIEEIGVLSGNGWQGVANWQTPGDPMYGGPDSPFTSVEHVLHWYAASGGGAQVELIFPGESLSGFGFTASFAEIDAPYQASWTTFEVQTGDPAFPLGGFPGSPLARGVPLPSAALMGLGLLGILGLAARLRRRKAA